jgi:SAM-dependent methyltransferase
MQSIEPVYENNDIVDVWLKKYTVEKERQFIKCIDECIPRDLVNLLDIGCGTGLHSALWSERGKTVTASDYSTKFRDHVERTYRFPFIWADVLNCSIREQYDICFCMAIATILGEEKSRFKTFETLSRLVRPDGFLVLITSTNQRLFLLGARAFMHPIDEKDLKRLAELGFEIERAFCWGSSPKFLWSSPGTRVLATVLEAAGTRLGVGARKVVICRRRARSLFQSEQALAA